MKGPLPPPDAASQGPAAVLVTSGGGFQGQAAIQALRRIEGVRIVMADCHEHNLGRLLVDAFWRVPLIRDEAAFLDALSEICEVEGVGLIVPATDRELPVLARVRASFAAEGVAVAVSEPGFLETCRDKQLLYPTLERAGLPVLPLVDPMAAEARYPLLAKPARSWGSRGLVVLQSPDDLPPDLCHSHVFQPFLDDFEELSIDLSMDLDGLASTLGLRRRLRVSGGFAVISEGVEDPEAETVVARFLDLAQAEGGCGLFNVQLLRHDGQLFVSDVNPRIGTSAVHWNWPGSSFEPMRHLLASAFPGRVAPPGTGLARPRKRSFRSLREEWRDAEPPPSPPRGVVFDLDDTLLDHKAWIVAKLERVHDVLANGRAVRLPERASFLLEAMCQVEEGHLRTLIDDMAARFGLSEEGRQDLLAAYRAAVPAHAPLYDDVWPTLASLRGAGLALGLLTDNPPASQRSKIERCGLAPWFDTIVFAREEGGEKPEVASFLSCASRLGLDPAELVMVGDNPYRDLLGAHRAGYGGSYLIRRQGALHAFRPELLASLHPDVIPRAVLEGLRGLTTELLGARARGAAVAE